MKWFSVFVIVLHFVFTSNGISQTVKFIIRDAKTDEPIPNVLLSIKNIHDILQNKEYKSNIKGEILFNELFNYDRLFYTLSHPIYKTFEGRVFSKSQDSIELFLYLTPIKYKDLKTINLKASSIIDTAYGSKELSVLDFEVIGRDSLLLLAYSKTKNKSDVLVFTVHGKEVKRFQLPCYMEEIIRDYRGNISVLSMDSALCITIGRDSFVMNSVTKDYYLNYIAPIVDTTTTKQILSNYAEIYPAFDYFTRDLIDSAYRKITKIQDDWMMELYRSEYKWVDVRTKLWAKEKEQESGIDAEVWVGANYFTRSLYWEEVYAPMFERNDSIFIFNYPKDLLEIYNKDGDFIKSIEIYHHYNRRKSGFRRNVLQDPVTGAVFALFEIDGFSYIGPISTETGEIKNKFKLGMRYVQKIRVFNNKVYYVYRPFESMQKRFLYKETLPYKFRPAKVNKDYFRSTETGK